MDELLETEEYSQYILNKQPEKWLPKFFRMVRNDVTSHYDVSQFDQPN